MKKKREPKISQAGEMKEFMDGDAEEQIRGTLKKRADIQGDFSLRALNSYAKNNLQMIYDFVAARPEGIINESVAEALEEHRDRTKSIALVYDQLSGSHIPDRIEFTKYVSSLVNTIIRSHKIRSSQISFKLKMDEAMLKLDSAIPCGLIITELVSDSLKYAFPDGRIGEICIEFRSLGADIYRLTICDNGLGIRERSDFNNSRIPMLQLLNPLIKEIDGCIKIDRSDGNRTEICFNELKYDHRLKAAQSDLHKARARPPSKPSQVSVPSEIEKPTESMKSRSPAKSSQVSGDLGAEASSSSPE